VSQKERKPNSLVISSTSLNADSKTAISYKPKLKFICTKDLKNQVDQFPKPNKMKRTLWTGDLERVTIPQLIMQHIPHWLKHQSQVDQFQKLNKMRKI